MPKFVSQNGRNKLFNITDIVKCRASRFKNSVLYMRVTSQTEWERKKTFNLFLVDYGKKKGKADWESRPSDVLSSLPLLDETDVGRGLVHNLKGIKGAGGFYPTSYWFCKETVS